MFFRGYPIGVSDCRDQLPWGKQLLWTVDLMTLYPIEVPAFPKFHTQISISFPTWICQPYPLSQLVVKGVVSCWGCSYKWVDMELDKPLGGIWWDTFFFKGTVLKNSQSIMHGIMIIFFYILSIWFLSNVLKRNQKLSWLAAFSLQSN